MLTVALNAIWSDKISKGYPWVTKQGLLNPVLNAQSGQLVKIVSSENQALGLGYINTKSNLICRMLTRDITASIDEAFFLQAFTVARDYRERFFQEPYYRLIHAEGDRLPGLIIDRFDDTFVCQTSTAGMETLKPLWLAALKALFNPSRIILRDNVPARIKEGLDLSISNPIGELEGLIEVKENGARYYADPVNGQKTGWFYDQRANREWVADQCANKTVLDLYTYHGGFGILCAVKGAQSVTLVDSSKNALEFAAFAASSNKVEAQCQYVQGNVMELLTASDQLAASYDVVIVDPPAFIKESKYKNQGLQGYQKLAKLAAHKVAPGGILFMASCSHHAYTHEFRAAVEAGITKAGRTFTLLHKGAAGKDHPNHGQLPQNQYLKAFAYLLE